MSTITRHTRPAAAILAAFIQQHPKALKKYDVEKECGLARETVRQWMPRMERYGWIRGQPAGKSNAGKNMFNYTLTERGLFQASCLNPTLRPRVKRLLGGSYNEIEKARASAERRRLKEYFEGWLPTLTKIIDTCTAQPGFYYCLELTADKNGKIHLGKRTRVGLHPIS